MPVHGGDLQVVEINVVKDRRVALDEIVEPDAEAVDGVGVFQDGMDTHLDRIAVDAAGPLAQGIGAHVVAGAGGRGQDEPAHQGLTDMGIGSATMKHSHGA